MDFNAVFNEFIEKYGDFKDKEKFAEIMKEIKIRNSIKLLY
jgi:hypothetical protein